MSSLSVGTVSFSLFVYNLVLEQLCVCLIVSLNDRAFVVYMVGVTNKCVR